MKLNEGIYKSPKWLKNLINFELRTGKDVPLTTKEKESKKQDFSEKELRQKWFDELENIYDRIDDTLLYQIFLILFNYDENSRYDSDLYKKLRKRFEVEYFKNFEIFERIKSVYKKILDKEAEKKQYEIDLNAIIDKIYTDFNNYPYSDKLKNVEYRDKYYKFEYKFENFDNLVRMTIDEYNRKFQISFKNEKNQFVNLEGFGLLFTNKLIQLVNFIYNSGKQRPYNSNSYKKTTYNTYTDKEEDYDDLYYEYEKFVKNNPEYYNLSYEDFVYYYNEIYNKKRKNSNKEEIFTDYSTDTHDVKKNKYNLLRNTLNGYKRQLQKEKKEKKDTTYTENEIKNLENKISDMKSKYKYEKKVYKFNDFLNS